MDAVFKAITDPHRRMLLDALYERDGQTLAELCEHLPGMTRQGVMNHLGVLEGSDLITTLRDGRSKYHYLNPVPIRLIHDRWISRYADARLGRMVGIKRHAEAGGRGMDRPVHIYKTYIRASADDVWEAITNPDITAQYFYGTRVASDWAAGSRMTYAYPDGTLASDGEIISIDPPNRIEFTFTALWDPELEAEGPCREVWALTEHEGMVELTIELHDIAIDSKTLEDFSNGLPYITAGLKSVLETGLPLPSPSG